MSIFQPMSVSLIGYGVSNQALSNYFLSKEIDFLVRTKDKVATPQGVVNIYGENYLNSYEDIVFRSPSLRPDKIRTDGIITTEIKFALAKAYGFKIGITGSDGKTTTSTIISEILKADKKSTILCGNIGNPLISYLAKTDENTHIVAELSSFQLFDCEPYLDVAVITNITENHLDWHTSFDEYILSKLNIIKNSDKIVLDFDNDILKNAISQIPKDKHLVITSLEKIVPYDRENIDYVYVKDDFIFYNDEKILSLKKIKLNGKFNVKNYQSAIGALYPYVDKSSIEKVATNFSGVKNRCEFVHEKDGIEFYNSSIDTTPSRTINTLGTFKKENTILLLGGYDKKLDYTPLNKEVDFLKSVVLCGENASKIFCSIKNSKTKIFVEKNFEDAVKKAFSLAKKGDKILLSPASASFDMFSNYEERGTIFSKIAKGL